NLLDIVFDKLKGNKKVHNKYDQFVKFYENKLDYDKFLKLRTLFDKYPNTKNLVEELQNTLIFNKDETKEFIKLLEVNDDAKIGRHSLVTTFAKKYYSNNFENDKVLY